MDKVTTADFAPSYLPQTPYPNRCSSFILDPNSQDQERAMAKANLTLADGTTVAISGSAEEVAKLLERFSGAGSRPHGGGTKRKPTSGSQSKKKAAGPIAHILALRDDKFFKTRQTLPDIQKKLEEGGHIYAQSSLSPALVRLVRRRELRRIKDKKGWVYVS
jgi:hypothetical protein